MADALPSPKEMIEKLLSSMSQLDASDLHLKVGYPPHFRVKKSLRGAKMAPLPDSAYVEAMLHDLIPDKRQAEYDETGGLDFGAQGSTGDRYRINMFRSSGELNVAIRRVQHQIPTFEQLNLPKVYQETVAEMSEGLILVSGVTGCGKSSTLAAIVENINQTRHMHIITIEDPIEFIFEPKKSIISQREIGIDVPDYHFALRDVVRQDPDCIMIGELRDKETMLAALQAAETGHLVLGSLHVADVQQTFARILEFFPNSEHGFIRASLAASFKAILCQRLLPGTTEGSLFPATEVLLKDLVVKDKILNGKDSELTAVMDQDKEMGMRTFTKSLVELIEEGKVHYDTAMDHAPNRDLLESAIKGIKS